MQREVTDRPWEEKHENYRAKNQDRPILGCISKCASLEMCMPEPSVLRPDNNNKVQKCVLVFNITDLCGEPCSVVRCIANNNRVSGKT